MTYASFESAFKDKDEPTQEIIKTQFNEVSDDFGDYIIAGKDVAKIAWSDLDEAQKEEVADLLRDALEIK